jgi:hypothetical protein
LAVVLIKDAEVVSLGLSGGLDIWIVLPEVYATRLTESEHTHVISMTDTFSGARPYVDHSAWSGQGL